MKHFLPLLALPLAFRRMRKEHTFFIGLIVLGVLMSMVARYFWTSAPIVAASRGFGW